MFLIKISTVKQVTYLSGLGLVLYEIYAVIRYEIGKDNFFSSVNADCTSSYSYEGLYLVDGLRDSIRDGIPK